MKTILQNNRGIALMMVLTAIVILTAIMADFTFETKINKFKSYNIQDRSQARLTAEAGLNFALVRMRLYKEAYNLVQGNQNMQQFVNAEALNMIWNIPFAFPIPEMPNFTAAQKEIVKKFTEKTLLDGSLMVTVTNISSGMNLNLLRVSMKDLIDHQNKTNAPDYDPTKDEHAEDQYKVENQLYNTLHRTLELKRDTDVEFYERNSGLEIMELIGNIKYYVSDRESYTDPMLGIAQAKFEDQDLTPKYGPFSSASEMYLIPGWTDELVEIIANEFSAYGLPLIDLNKITDKMLRLLVPNMNEDDVKTFFQWRDNPSDPHPIQTLNDFKNYICSTAHLMDQTAFEERFHKFELAGIKFGPSPSLFKIVSSGVKGRATYKLTAYIMMPARPPAAQNNKNGSTKTTGNNSSNPNANAGNSTTTGNNARTTAEQATQLLEPKVIEIFVN